MTRYHDWERRLDQFFLGHARTVFAYGLMDCANFAAGAWEAETGVTLMDGVGTYTDEKSALKMIGEYLETKSPTVGAMAEAICLKHALKERDTKWHAQRGDIVLFANWADDAIGVVALDGKSIAMLGEGGLTKIKLSRAIKAWGG